MKRYIFSIAALLVAAGMVAFTGTHKDAKPLSTIAFYYVAPGGTDYSQPSVQNKANWISNPGSTPSCSGANKACEMDVTSGYTHLDAFNVRQLNTTGSSVPSIAAVEGGTADNYVPYPATSVGIPSKSDKP